MFVTKQVSVLDLSPYSIKEGRGHSFVCASKDSELEFSLAGPDQEADLVETVLGPSFLLTTAQATAMLGLNYHHLGKMVEKQELRDFGVGRNMAFSLRQVLRLRAGHPAMTPAEREEASGE